MRLFVQTTQGGYSFGDVVSSLQKEVRRGNHRQALYWAYEIESCGGMVNARYLWNRLKVIASEDIGPTADGNLMAILLHCLMDSYIDAFKRRNDSTRIFLSHAIIAMCRSKKSRIADNLSWAVALQDEELDVPDYALDKHTNKGRDLQRDLDHWVEEASKLENEDVELADESEELLDECVAAWRINKKSRHKRDPYSPTTHSSGRKAGDGQRRLI